jgi:hypothetical protein
MIMSWLRTLVGRAIPFPCGWKVPLGPSFTIHRGRKDLDPFSQSLGVVVVQSDELRLLYCLDCGADLRIPTAHSPSVRPALCPVCSSSLFLSGIPREPYDSVSPSDQQPDRQVVLPSFLITPGDSSDVPPTALPDSLTSALEDTWRWARAEFEFDSFMATDGISWVLERRGVDPENARAYARRMLLSLIPR